MTNAEIIFRESLKLMNDGVLKKKTFKMDDGNEMDIPMPIHTYARWKSFGYQVKKGEHAIAKFSIWKYTSKKTKDMTEEQAQENGYCFMKQSAFFSEEQVEPLQKEGE